MTRQININNNKKGNPNPNMAMNQNLDGFKNGVKQVRR
jgi:hypothetical protein